MRHIYFLLFSLFQITVLLGEPIANSEYIWIPSIKDIDFTDKKSIDSYINHPRNDNDSYLDIKERAQEVVNFLYLKLDEKQKSLEGIYIKEYAEMLDPNSDEYRPHVGERLPVILEAIENSYFHLKEHIKSEKKLIIEDSIGGTGAFFFSNCWEIDRLIEELY
jgi:hypothetical protein